MPRSGNIESGAPPGLASAAVNIVLFESSETARPLPRDDARARHILTVLRRSVGDTLDVGLVGGPRGKATLHQVSDTAVELKFSWEPAHPAPCPTLLAVGFPRPQTARDILREATTLGATELSFVTTDRSDPNYPSSSLWHEGEWQRHIITGAAQAFDTFVPEVNWHDSLTSTAARWRAAGHRLIGLDVYGAHPHLARLELDSADASGAIFIGPERGWHEADRAVLAAAGVEWFNLGSRVLRTETAVIAGLTLINAARARA